MDNTFIAIGLGNPGFEYEATRHNVGFMVADELSARLKCVWRPGKGDYLYCQSRVDGKILVIVKPLTYMNNSGSAVLEALEQFPAPMRNIVAIVDDFACSLGTIRVRTKGSDGGHNGLRSIIYHINSNEFPRVRCGIKKEAMPPKREMTNFVLSPFDKDEKKIAAQMITTAADAVEEFVRTGIERTMNKFN